MAALAACSKPDPTRISFGEHPNNAVILMRTGGTGIGYWLKLAVYDDTSHSIATGLWNGSQLFKVDPSPVPSYIALTVPPGTYAFQFIEQQNIWSLCFSNRSLAFTVNAGDAVFLGDFDARAHLKQLEELAIKHNEIKSFTGTMNDYFDPEILSPQISAPGPTTPDFLAAKQYEAAAMPSLRGRLQPVRYRPANFGVGYLLTGQRICGGVMKDKAAP
jgi:hypothetical protein